MRISTTLIGSWLLVALGHLVCTGVAAAQVTATPAGEFPVPAITAEGPSPATPCADGLVDDDGTAESGYGWVPSVIEGVFVQEYSGQEVATGALSSVCICWLRTRDDDTIDFDVVLYEFNSAEGMPNKTPFAAFPAQVSGLPDGIPGATFTEVDLDEVPVPAGKFYVGVRWNANIDQFFFACVDKTPSPTPPTRVFFRTELSQGWGDSSNTNDPTFNDHQAMLIRPVPSSATTSDISEIPLGLGATAILIVALMLAGVVTIRWA